MIYKPKNNRKRSIIYLFYYLYFSINSCYPFIKVLKFKINFLRFLDSLPVHCSYPKSPFYYTIFYLFEARNNTMSRFLSNCFLKFNAFNLISNVNYLIILLIFSSIENYIYYFNICVNM